jgi:hypothetical protein
MKKNLTKEVEIKTESLNRVKQLQEETDRLKKIIAESMHAKENGIDGTPSKHLLEVSDGKKGIRRSSSTQNVHANVNAMPGNGVFQSEVVDRKDNAKQNSSAESEKRLMEKIENLTAELKTANNKIFSLEKELTASRADISKHLSERESIIVSLREACSENIQLKNSIEEVLRLKILLDKELINLKDEKLSLGLTLNASEQKLESLKEEFLICERKVEELKSKILNPEYTGFIYNVVKESLLGKEQMLVS